MQQGSRVPYALRAIFLVLLVMVINTKKNHSIEEIKVIKKDALPSREVKKYCSRGNLNVDVRPKMRHRELPEYSNYKTFDNLIEVPKIIHQVGESHHVSKTFQPYMQTWLKLHPHWQYWFWTQEDVEFFIKTRYPNFLPVFMAYHSDDHRREAFSLMQAMSWYRRLLVRLWTSLPLNYQTISFGCLCLSAIFLLMFFCGISPSTFVSSAVDSYVGLMFYGTQSKIAEMRARAEENIRASKSQISKKTNTSIRVKFHIKPHVRLIIAVSSPATTTSTPMPHFVTPKDGFLTPKRSYVTPMAPIKSRNSQTGISAPLNARDFTTSTTNPRARILKDTNKTESKTESKTSISSKKDFLNTYSFINKYSKRYNPTIDARQMRKLGQLDIYKDISEFDQINDIPHIIHQIMTDKLSNATYKHWMGSWLKLNPGWQHWIWTEKEVDFLVMTRYSDAKEFYFKAGAAKFEVFRYFLLYEFGGVYAESDMECLRPLEFKIKQHDCMISSEPTLHYFSREGVKEQLISDAFMGCRPRHKFFGYIIDYLSKKDSNKFKYQGDASSLLADAYEEASRHTKVDLPYIADADTYQPVVDPKRTKEVTAACKLLTGKFKAMPGGEKLKKACRTYFSDKNGNKLSAESYAVRHWTHL